MLNLLHSSPVMSFQSSHCKCNEEKVLLSRANGGYNLVVSNDDSVSLVQISSEGKSAGKPSKLPGRLSPFGVRYTSKDGRHLLTIGSSSNKIVYVHDLDKLGWNLTLSGHTDSIMSAAYSPDGDFISTASWDGMARIYNKSTRELVHILGPTGSQNCYANFSPDGKYVVVYSGNYKASLPEARWIYGCKMSQICFPRAKDLFLLSFLEKSWLSTSTFAVYRLGSCKPECCAHCHSRKWVVTHCRMNQRWWTACRRFKREIGYIFD